MSFVPGFLRPPKSQFASPSFIYEIIHHPVAVLITFLHYLILHLRGPSYRPPVPSRSKPSIRVVCISDTHSKIPPAALPKGDLLIHAGDLTKSGSRAQIQQSIDWLKSLQKPWPGSSDGYMHIVVICGNHDSYLDERSRSAHDKAYKNQRLDWGKIHYLQHSSVTLSFLDGRKLKIYGAPQIPRCGGKEFAFQYERGQDAWSNTVPDDVDILVTHSPPKWHLDLASSGGLGDEFELEEVWRTKPTLQVCGHIHAGHGTEYLWWDKGQRLFEGVREHAYGSGKKQFSQPPFVEVLDILLYIEGMQVIWHDIKGLAWSRFWGGARQGSILLPIPPKLLDARTLFDFAITTAPPSTQRRAISSPECSLFFFLLFLLVIFAYAGWIGWSQYQARSAGRTPPTWKHYVPFVKSDTSATNYPTPRSSGPLEWIKDQVNKLRNPRSARGAYEETGGASAGGYAPAGARGRGGRGFEDDAWDTRVGGSHEDPYGGGAGGQGGGYAAGYEEQELGLAGTPGLQAEGYGGARGRQRGDNPFGDQYAAPSLRSVSPRPEVDMRSHQGQASLDSTGSGGDNPETRKSAFREEDMR